jgi:hypothetical protein
MARIGLHEVTADIGSPGLPQQLLDDRFRALVLAFAEMVVTDAALRIDEIQRRPIAIVERAPHTEVTVDRYRVGHAKHLHAGANVVEVALELELRRMHADDDQSLVLVLVGPGANVGLLALPIDAGVRPEIDEHNFPAQAFRRQRRRVEPTGGTGERGKRALDGERSGSGSGGLHAAFLRG